MNSSVFKQDDKVLLVSEDRKKWVISLSAGAVFHTNKGFISHDDLIGLPYGSFIKTHKDKTYLVVQPTLSDLILHGIKRGGQIIYPSDLSFIMQIMNITECDKVIEAGSGSGSTSIFLAKNMIKSGAKIYSYEIREDMLKVARENVAFCDLSEKVEFICRDVMNDGFTHNDADAIFIDLPKAYNAIPKCFEALRDGGVICVFTVTTNDSADIIRNLKESGFHMIEMCEILVRYYRTIANRLRPNDRMVAHTGYIISARKTVKKEGDSWVPVDSKGREIDF
ncbi:tRNA (adenine-N1)-methyltransferase [Anaplasmataceae bacterium AB001_6]|nr:tRNA (adenine-N1)-methyltransferase [Anaplasmataceae bacterium AB001_6]